MMISSSTGSTLIESFAGLNLVEVMRSGFEVDALTYDVILLDERGEETSFYDELRDVTGSTLDGVGLTTDQQYAVKHWREFYLRKEVRVA